jgi:hypothetical protein
MNNMYLKPEHQIMNCGEPVKENKVTLILWPQITSVSNVKWSNVPFTPSTIDVF